MAMRRRNFTGEDELQAGVERVRYLRFSSQLGIFKHEHATLSFFRADRPAGCQELRSNGRPLPRVGCRSRPGVGGYKAFQDLPQRSQVEGIEFLIERTAVDAVLQDVWFIHDLVLTRIIVLCSTQSR